jgi:molecular chaperone GrpE
MSGKNKKKDKGKKGRQIEISEPAVEETAVEEPAAREAKGEAEQEKPSVEQELAELRGRFQRLAADYQNYQKRSYKQIEQTGQFAREEIARSLLAVLDNFEHTLAKGVEFENVAAVLDGVKIVYDHLMSVMAGHGVTRIEIQTGDPFDPNLHEAMLHEESDECEENTVLRELAAGYRMNGRTLRPAKVSVAKASTADSG